MSLVWRWTPYPSKLSQVQVGKAYCWITTFCNGHTHFSRPTAILEDHWRIHVQILCKMRNSGRWTKSHFTDGHTSWIHPSNPHGISSPSANLSSATVLTNSSITFSEALQQATGSNWLGPKHVGMPMFQYWALTARYWTVTTFLFLLMTSKQFIYHYLLRAVSLSILTLYLISTQVQTIFLNQSKYLQKLLF